MKKLLYLPFLFLFFSCSSLIPSREGWSFEPYPDKGRLAPGNIAVDTVSLWDSLEKEIAGILPLLFLEKKYAPAADADVHVDVSLIEREYMEGWRIKRSLSVDVTIRGKDNFAAGRAMFQGTKSFASSKTTAKLLRLALAKALAAFERRNGK